MWSHQFMQSSVWRYNGRVHTALGRLPLTDPTANGTRHNLLAHNFTHGQSSSAGCALYSGASYSLGQLRCLRLLSCGKILELRSAYSVVVDVLLDGFLALSRRQSEDQRQQDSKRAKYDPKGQPYIPVVPGCERTERTKQATEQGPPSYDQQIFIHGLPRSQEPY